MGGVELVDDGQGSGCVNDDLKMGGTSAVYDL